MADQPPRPSRSLSLSALLVVAAVLCFVLAALQAFSVTHISGAPAAGFVAVGLALWAAAAFA